MIIPPLLIPVEPISFEFDPVAPLRLFQCGVLMEPARVNFAICCAGFPSVKFTLIVDATRGVPNMMRLLKVRGIKFMGGAGF